MLKDVEWLSDDVVKSCVVLLVSFEGLYVEMLRDDELGLKSIVEGC